MTTDDLDSLPWTTGEPRLPNGARGRKCRRHEWPASRFGGVPWPATCVNCMLTTEDPDAYFLPPDSDPEMTPYANQCHGDAEGVHRLGFRCLHCFAVRNPVVSRTNRNNRKRGNRTSHDLAAYLGGRNVEALKLPWDVEAAGARIQSKRLKVRPSVAEIIRLVEYIDAGPSLRALYWVGAGQRIASGHVFMLLREWVAEHGWSAPAVGVVHSASTPGTAFVLELPVATFREMRAGTRE